MFFIPYKGYVSVEVINEAEEKGNFQWEKVKSDLVAVRVLSSYDGSIVEDKVAIVISSMIQEFEYKKNKFKLVPDSAIVGFVEYSLDELKTKED
jgi:hypothetical protein